MKQALFTSFLFCCVALTSWAQTDSVSSPFLFKDLQDVAVHLKDGRVFHEKMNYNLLVEKFYFVDRADGQTKVLSNPETINVIKFGSRTFYPENGAGIEILSTDPALYVQYKGRISKEPAIAGYGTSQLASIKTYKGMDSQGGQSFAYEPDKMLVDSHYNIYWIEKDGNKKEFINFKKLLKIYSEHKKELELYIKENNVKFDDSQQVLKLCVYAESLGK